MLKINLKPSASTAISRKRYTSKGMSRKAIVQPAIQWFFHNALRIIRNCKKAFGDQNTPFKAKTLNCVVFSEVVAMVAIQSATDSAIKDTLDHSA